MERLMKRIKMKRLTKRINGVVTYIGKENSYDTGQIAAELNAAACREILERLAAYEDTGLSPQACIEAGEIEAGLSAEDYSIHRMVELMRVDKDGRLVVLPCKVGEGLWTFCIRPVEQVYSFTVTDISTLNGRTMLNTSRCGVIDARDVGKTVFLTREEAEKALEGRK